MNFLLDTNACIALINGAPSAVRVRQQRETSAGSQLHVSTIGLFEMRFGIEKSARREANLTALEDFLKGPVAVIPLDRADAEAAGMIRFQLEKMGRPLGAYDTLIAGQAIARGWTLVTANVREFSRVRGLTWEDWGRV